MPAGICLQGLNRLDRPRIVVGPRPCSARIHSHRVPALRRTAHREIELLADAQQGGLGSVVGSEGVVRLHRQRIREGNLIDGCRTLPQVHRERFGARNHQHPRLFPATVMDHIAETRRLAERRPVVVRPRCPGKKRSDRCGLSIVRFAAEKQVSTGSQQAPRERLRPFSRSVDTVDVADVVRDDGLAVGHFITAQGHGHIELDQ